MKLIDLLVQELPKRGGWPEGAEAVVQDADDMEFYFYTGGPVENTGKSWWFKDQIDGSEWIFYEGKFEVADDHDTSTVTREQYESALAASQKVKWSGDGLPPVGCECEFIGNDTSWGAVKIIGYDRDGVVFRPNLDSSYYLFKPSEKHIFRPIRSEADKKRDEAINSLTEFTLRGDACDIYDAIAAGKIPGVKLED